MVAKQLYLDAMKRWESFDVRGLLPALRYANDGSIEDVRNVNGCRYYQWSACLIDVLQPKQVVELGGAMGVWALCVLHYLATDAKLYSITLPEGGLEFSYAMDDYPNFVKVLGNDLDLGVWPKDLDLKHTDLWFFDALHTPEHLTKEFELYSPFFKKGAVILVDDIRSFDLYPVWESVEKYGITDKYECTNPCHYSGFGIAVV